MFRAYIFDLDGTLVDTEELHYQAYYQAIIPYGHNLSREEYIQYWLDGNLGMKSYFEAKNIASNYQQARLTKEKIFVKNLPASIKLQPHAREFLAKAQAAGIICLLASGSRLQEIRNIIEKSALKGYFQHILGLESVTHGKPHPEIYLKACKFLDLPKNQILVFENARNGALAAIAAGLKCVVIPSELTKNQDFSFVTRCYNTFAEITPLELTGMFSTNSR